MMTETERYQKATQMTKEEREKETIRIKKELLENWGIKSEGRVFFCEEERTDWLEEHD